MNQNGHPCCTDHPSIDGWEKGLHRESFANSQTLYKKKKNDIIYLYVIDKKTKFLFVFNPISLDYNQTLCEF